MEVGILTINEFQCVFCGEKIIFLLKIKPIKAGLMSPVFFTL